MKLKKVIGILLISMMAIGVTLDVDAKTTKKSGKRGSSSHTLTVKKEAIKNYGDYLTTQIFSVKKGKDNSLIIEYPISGNPALVNAMRESIKQDLYPTFTGSLETPEALMRSVMKQVKDVSFGEEGESLSEEIKVIYSTPDLITLESSGYSYAGGMHGMYWDMGNTFLVNDGTVLDIDMFPPISNMRSKILEGIADEQDVSVSDLDDFIYNPYEIDYPVTVYLTEKGINFVYQPYDIGPYSSGIITSVVPATPEVINMMTPQGQRFFK